VALLIDQRLPFAHGCLAVEAEVVDVEILHEELHQVQELGPLGEEQDAVALMKKALAS
jgi:hypothetical protein